MGEGSAVDGSAQPLEAQLVFRRSSLHCTGQWCEGVLEPLLQQLVGQLILGLHSFNSPTNAFPGGCLWVGEAGGMNCALALNK